ncbi:MAG: AAA family ATPase [Deltaproteobacteria bacterium]|nr:AAA family ATPase [Deltaproteobacteria bacterium]
MTPREIYQELDRFVIGQERAKRTIAIAAYNHMKRILHAGNLLRKSNILMIGPTGSGKTHIARSLARIFVGALRRRERDRVHGGGILRQGRRGHGGGTPFFHRRRFRAAERGIIFIDEIDKLARRNDAARTGASGRDIGGEGVQQGILKLLESNKIFVPINVTQHWNKHDFVQMDVSTFSSCARVRLRI